MYGVLVCVVEVEVACSLFVLLFSAPNLKFGGSMVDASLEVDRQRLSSGDAGGVDGEACAGDL